MSETEDKQYELNRVSIMSAADIESRVIPPQPRLVENYMLDKVMTKIMWQPNGMETVLNIMLKTEIDFDKYKNSFLYLWVLCGPVRLVKLIDERFKQNPITEDLWKLRLLYDDPLELALCRAAYIGNIVSFVLTCISPFIAILFKSPWFLSIILIWFACLFAQYAIFKHTMRFILFTKIYKQIVDIIENHYDLHCAYVQRVFEIPQQIEERWQRTQAQMIEDGMSNAEIRNRKSLELETGSALQVLGAAIALQQAKDDAEIHGIKNKTQLDYLQKELKIKNEELHDPSRQHELIRASVDAMGQFLVKRAETLAIDDQEKRNINYQLNLLNGIRNGDVPYEQVCDTFDEFREMETKMKDEGSEYIKRKGTKKSKSANDTEAEIETEVNSEYEVSDDAMPKDARKPKSANDA
jgi:hypothetical protein